MQPILVLGHKNPDNDSVCSAVAYAYLKNELAKRSEPDEALRPVYVPARLGPLPPETAAVLNEVGIEAPRVVANLYSRVSDVMTPEPFSINRDATLLEAGRMLRHHNVRALVVTDDDGLYCGLITTRMIAERYIASTDVLEQGASEFAVASNLIASLDQKVHELCEEDVLKLDRDDKLDDAVEDLMNTPLREAVVIDEDGYPVGIVTRSDVATRPRRKVILVDHNEKRQAANGIEQADVVEIIDHHRIADVSTTDPIRFINLPVGSSATIVTQEFQRHNVFIPTDIAEVLLSAIMTDTVILKSPTTTPTDRRIAKFLADILETDVTQFGMKVFSYRGGDDDLPMEELVGADAKEFAIGDETVLIAQHETVNLDAVMAREAEIRAYMEQRLEQGGYTMFLLMVTDIIAEGSQFIAVGDLRLVNRAFGIKCTGEGGTWMPGILSRKKQVAPRILSA